jgi:hypothetical protein
MWFRMWFKGVHKQINMVFLQACVVLAWTECLNSVCLYICLSVCIMSHLVWLACVQWIGNLVKCSCP